MCQWGKSKKIKLCQPNEISKRTIVDVDYCIADIVQKLNNKKIRTLGCCCGHFKNPGEIIIEDKNKNKIFISIKEAKKLCNCDI